MMLSLGHPQDFKWYYKTHSVFFLLNFTLRNVLYEILKSYLLYTLTVLEKCLMDVVKTS